MRILLINRDPQPDDWLRANYSPDTPGFRKWTAEIESGTSPEDYIGRGVLLHSRQHYRIVDAKVVGYGDDREVEFGVVRNKAAEGPPML